MRWIYFLFLIPQLLLAQQTVVHYQTADGLPHEITYGIFQDNKGHIWIGTDDGLAKFDGKKFVNFSVDDGLRNNYVIAVTQDDYDNILVATWGGGIHTIKDNQVLENLIPGDSGEKLNNLQHSSGRVLAKHIKGNMVYQETEGVYDTRNVYVIVRDDNRLKLTQRKNDRGLGYLSVLDSVIVGHYGNLNFQSDKRFLKGIHKLEADNSFTTIFPFLLDEVIDFVGTLGKNKFVATSKDQLFIFNHDRILQEFVLGLDGKIITKAVPNGSESLVILAADDNGYKEAWQINLTTGDTVNLRDVLNLASPVSDVLVDHEKNLWITTFGNGVYCVLHTTFQITRIESDIGDNNIHGIVEYGNIVYVLTSDELHFFEKAEKTASLPLGGFAKDILLTNQDSIIISSIQLKEKAVHGRIQEKTAFRTFEVDSLGLVIYSDELSIPALGRSFSTEKRVVNDVVFYNDTLLLATNYGVYYIDESHSKIMTKRFSKPLLSTHVKKFKKAEDGLFIATMKGLNFISNTTWESYTVDNGLIHNNINTLELDSREDLWIGTQQGISILRDKSLTSFGQTEGLLSPHVNVLFEDSDSQMWVGGIDGISLVDNSQSLELSEAPLLNVDQYENSFAYNTISYNRPTGLITQYRLNDLDWVSLPNSSGTYETKNFGKGDYTLEFRARKQDGIWGYSPVYSFEVKIPWHEDPLFYVVGLVLVFCLILTIVFRQLRIVRNRNRVLKLAIKKQIELENKLSNVRKNIAQDFHDDLGNKLARITLFSNMLLNESGRKDEIKRKLTQITEDANYLYKGTRDFVFSLKEESDYIEELVTYISDFGQDCFKNTNIRFLVDKELDSNERLPYYWSKQLIYIFKEALTNALKHSGASEVILKFKYKDKNLLVSCQDNGVGISGKSHLDNNGIDHMKQRAAKIDGFLEVRSSNLQGTEVVFSGKTA